MGKARIRLIFDGGGTSLPRTVRTVESLGVHANAELVVWDVKADAPPLISVEVHDWRGDRYLEVPPSLSRAAGCRVVLPVKSLIWTDQVEVGSDPRSVGG